MTDSEETPAAPKKKPPKKRNRPSRAAEPVGPVHPREMTRIRDEVARIRDLPNSEQKNQALDELWTMLDRLDLRFKIHHDPSKGGAQGELPL